MHIILIAHFAGSPRHGMVYGHYYLAREWVKSGNHVTIVAASYAHTRFTQPEVNDHIVEEYIDGIRYLWIPTPAYSSAGRIGRVSNIFAFVMRVWMTNLPIQRADVIICTSHHPFAIHPARFLARRFRARLVFEVRDLWPLTLIELGGATQRHPFIKLMQFSEDYAYKHADKVISVLPAAKDYMVEHGMHPDKFLYVPNGVDMDEALQNVELPPAYIDIIEKLRSEGKFLVGYAGRVGLSNALHSLIDAIGQCTNSNIALIILGDGSHVSELKSQAKRIGVEGRIVFLNSVPKSQVYNFLERMDVVYIGLQSQPLFRFGVSPTKINDYMLAAKPIIYAIDAPGNPVTECGAGISCGAENAIEISGALYHLSAMCQKDLSEMGNRGRQWIINNRDYRVLADIFLKNLY